jgi:hypothetical protein
VGSASYVVGASSPRGDSLSDQDGRVERMEGAWVGNTSTETMNASAEQLEWHDSRRGHAGA